MRETVGSLRAYFIACALLLVMAQVLSMSAPVGVPPIAAIFFALVSMGFAIIYLYLGAMLPSLLPRSVHVVMRLIYASMAWAVVLSGLEFLAVWHEQLPVWQREEMLVGTGIQLGIGALVPIYLLFNTRRLSNEIKRRKARF